MPSPSTPHALAHREATVLDAVRRRATVGSPRVLVSVAELAKKTGLDVGEVSRALTVLWLHGRIRLDQAPCSGEPSVIDLITAEEERGGKGGSVEESEQISAERTELIEKQTDQIVSFCSDGVGHVVPGEAAPSTATGAPDRADGDTGSAPAVSAGVCGREPVTSPAAASTPDRAGADDTANGSAPSVDANASEPVTSLATADTDERVILARECADRLGSYDSLPAFVALARRYAPGRLHDALAVVLALPEARIRKSRAALFTFLVKHGV